MLLSDLELVSYFEIRNFPEGLVFVRDLFHSVLDVLYPPLCLSCSELLADRSACVCDGCMQEVRRVDRSDPEFCSIRDLICGGAIIEDVVSPFWFDKRGPLQSIIHALKYQNIPQAGEHLGRELGRTLQVSGIEAGVVVPVPLHRVREREREYNQAEHIAHGVASITGAKVVARALKRLHNTSTQTELTAAERRTNVEGAFGPGAFSGCDLTGVPILLVDDVLTTGATIAEAAAVLRRTFSGPVFAGTIAIAARRHA